MGLIYNGGSDAAVVQRLVHLVTWCRVGVQFLEALERHGIRMTCRAVVTAGGTHYVGGPHGGVLHVNLAALNALPKGRQAALVLHELFHCVHRHIDAPSYRRRNQIGGEVGHGLGGWQVAGSAEEQLAITGHLVMASAPSVALQAWAAEGFCENRVLRHLGYPLRNSHGAAAGPVAAPRRQAVAFEITF